jgi:hypothetical protein
VDVLLRNFDRASDHEKLDFESVLLDVARKAEADGRVGDSIKFKLRLLELRQRRGNGRASCELAGRARERGRNAEKCRFTGAFGQAAARR